MPRHTHPTPVRKHSRAHTREQRRRYIERRWRQAKDRHSYLPFQGPHPEAVERQPASGGRWRLVDAGSWPFYLPDNFFTRNPWTCCSCLMCTWDKRMDPRRAREERAWRRLELEAGEDAA